MDPKDEFRVIRERLNGFRSELKEDRIFKKMSNVGEKGAVERSNRRFVHSASFEDISRVLEVDCIITPFSPLRNGEWPVALTSNFSEKCADVGSIESHGSFWRLVRKDAGSSGTNVVLQSSEIGGKSQYLTPSLALSSDLHDAAIWSVKIQPTGHAGQSHHQERNADYLLPSNAFGSLLQFELVPRNSDGSVESSYLRGESQARRKLLVSAKAISGSGERGVAILSESERQATNTFHWSITWQVTKEDSAIDGFAFLDTVELDFYV